MQQTAVPADDVARDFGAIVHQNEFSVTRAKTVVIKGGHRTQIVVHQKSVSGVEQLPRGYIIGTNMLWMDHLS